MQAVVNTGKLIQELRLLDKIVPNKPTLPVLGNILLRAEGKQLFLSATDLEIGLITSCDAWVALPGSVTIPSKRFFAMVDQQPDADLQITSDGNGTCQFSCGAYRSRLQTLPVANFPNMPEQEGTPVAIPAPMFLALLDKTRYAVAEKGERTELAGGLLELNEGKLTVVSTDGKRLSLAMIPDVTGEPLSAILPMRTMDILKASHLDGSVEFSRNNRHLFFKIGPRLMFSRMLDGQFPSYKRVIPTDLDKTVVINRALFMAALKRVGLVADAASQAIFMSFTKGQIQITGSSSQVGDADEVIAAEYEGPDHKICANWKLVHDFLNAAVGKTITLQFKTGYNAVLLTDGENFLNVLMLIRP